MTQHIELGQSGEALAVAFLESHGMQVLDRNWRCHAGELDIVAREGNRIVIIEVKTRRGLSFGHPFEALTPSKVARLYRLAVLWCVEHGWRGDYRIDAVAVLLPPDQPAMIEHLKAIG